MERGAHAGHARARRSKGAHARTHMPPRTHSDQSAFYVRAMEAPPPAPSTAAAAVGRETGASSADSVVPMGPQRTSWGMGQVRRLPVAIIG